MSTFRCRQCGIPMEDYGQRGLCSGCEILDVLPDKLAERKTLGGIPFQDMKGVDEVDRIKKVCQYLRDNPGKVIMVMVDCGAGYEGKGDRWIAAVKELMPAAKVLRRVLNKPDRDIESIYFRYQL